MANLRKVKWSRLEIEDAVIFYRPLVRGYLKEQARLDAELRASKGLGEKDPIDALDTIETQCEALIGAGVIGGWSGWEDDGKPIPDHVAGVPFDEAATVVARLLLGNDDIYVALMKASSQAASAYWKDEETAAKN